MAAATSAYFAMQGIKKELDKPADAAKRARQLAAQRTEQARERAKEQQGQMETRTLVTNPLGLAGQAETVRKTLTGQ